MEMIGKDEILRIITNESSKSVENLSKTLFSRTITALTMEAVVAVGAKVEMNGVSDTFRKNFKDSIIGNITCENTIASLTTGKAGVNFASELAELSYKYATMETEHRVNELSKEYGMTNEEYDRKDIIVKVRETFGAEDINTTLSESYNEETQSLCSFENDIIQSAAEMVKTSIDDANEKSEVVKTIADEFKDVTETVEAMRGYLEFDPLKAKNDNFDPEADDNFVNSMEFIKENIPVTATRFTLEYDSGKFTDKFVTGILNTLSAESASTITKDVKFIKDRFKFIRMDGANNDSFKVEQLDEVEKLFTRGAVNYENLQITFADLGFGNGGGQASNTKGVTINLIKNLHNFIKETEGVQRQAVTKISTSKVDKIVTLENFAETAANYMIMKSVSADLVDDFKSWESATESLNSEILEFVSSSSDGDISKLYNGVRLAANAQAIKYFDTDRLGSTYYKTLQVAKGSDLVNFDGEATRVKGLVADLYETNKYEGVVDSFFGDDKKVTISEENMYEVFLYGAGMKMSNESEGQLTEDGKFAVVNIAKSYAAYVQTIESLGLLNKEAMKRIVESIVA